MEELGLNATDDGDVVVFEHGGNDDNTEGGALLEAVST